MSTPRHEASEASRPTPAAARAAVDAALLVYVDAVHPECIPADWVIVIGVDGPNRSDDAYMCLNSQHTRVHTLLGLVGVLMERLSHEMPHWQQRQ